jgi:uncharacterized protein
MNALQFEWDDKKEKTNVTKHNVSFEETKTVFYDEQARLIEDLIIRKTKTDSFF